MSEGFQFLDIILFAMIAAFLVLRLRGVLGRRTGHQTRPRDNMTQPRKDSDAEGTVVELPDRAGTDRAGAEDAAGEESEDVSAVEPLAAGLARIRAADPSFDPGAFRTGARVAFEMIVHAFATGDTGTLRTLLDKPVLENFQQAIADRLEAAETLETTLIGIKSAEILDASMRGRDAVLTLKFVSEQVNVTRDAEGNVIEGDPSHVAEVTDIWTFSRNTRSRDPNWRLTATRSVG